MSDNKKKTVLLFTGTTEVSKTLVNKVETAGYGYYHFPLIQLETILPNPNFERAFGKVKYDLIVFSSAKGVTSFFDLLSHYFAAIYKPTDFKYAVVGSKTNTVLEQYGVKALYIGNQGANSLLSILTEQNLADCKVFIPKSDVGLHTLQNGLIAKELCVVNTYCNKSVSSDLFGHSEFNVDNGVNYFLLFQSPSAVENYITLCKAIGRNTDKNIVGIGSIGSTTSKAVVSNGLEVSIESKESTIEDLIESVIKYLETSFL